MFKLIQKYKIKNIDDYLFNDNIKNIIKIINIDNLKNFIIHGSKGCGKKGLIYSLFNYPKKKKNLFKNKLSKEITVNFYRSNFFLEFDVREFGIYDKFIISNIIKELTTTRSVSNLKKKLIIFHNADYLSKNAQIVLKIISEKCSNNCNFILLCENINNIIKKLKSIFIILRIPKISKENIKNKFNNIIQNENIKICEKNIKKIENNYKYNYKKMINNLDYYNNTKKILSNNFDNIINELIKCVKKKILSKKNIINITKLLYNIIMDYKDRIKLIIPNILEILINEINNDDIIEKIIELSIKYDNNLIFGSKEIIHLESYFYNLIKIYKN